MSYTWSNPNIDWTAKTVSGDQFAWTTASDDPPKFNWNNEAAQPSSSTKKANRTFYQSAPVVTSPVVDTPANETEPEPESAAFQASSLGNMNEDIPKDVSEKDFKDEIFDLPNKFASDSSPFTEGLRYHSRSLPENAPEVVAEKLKTEMKGIEFTRANITEGSPWSSNAFVQQLDLPEWLKNALYDLRVDRLSKIQKIVIPKLIAGQNVVAQSQSGTGKTIAFLTAAFKNVDANLAKPQVLIVLPTLELALQVCNVSDHIGKNNREVLIRQALRRERFDSEATEHIILGTPGKLLELILRLKRIDCSHIKMVVFDEADNLFDVNQNRQLMLFLKDALPPSVQVVMFSATFSDEFCNFIDSFCPNSEILRLQQDEIALDNIRQLYVKVHNKHEKLSILIRILRSIECGSCFIFTQTKEDAKTVFNALAAEGYSVGTLSSEYEVQERKQSLEALRNGAVRYLVATNVSARGIDIPNVGMVINYSLPHNPHTRSVDHEVYLHRIGRCGRFGKQGLALSFADRFNSEDYIQDLISYFAKPITELTIENGELSMESQMAISS